MICVIIVFADDTDKETNIMKTIFFDFGRTIVEHPEDGAGLTLVKNAGVKDEEDAKLIRDVIFSVGKYANFLDEGSMERDEYKRLLKNELPERLHEYAIKATDYHISVLPMIKGMKELLQKLKNDGFKMYITSNLDEYHSNQMHETEVAKYVDGMLFSSEIKVRKPYKEFFEAAFERFSVKPEDCIFIDDLAENVEGAEKCGIKGFVFKGNPDEAEKFIYENGRD